MTTAQAIHEPSRPKAPGQAPVLAWALLGVALAALLVVSVVEMNRLMILGLVTLPLLTLVAVNIEFGIYCLIGYSTILAFLIRMMPPSNTGPIGTALDGLLLIMMIRLGLDLAVRRDWRIFASPLTMAVVAFLVYQCVEVFNPAAPSIMFGLFGLRVTMRIAGFFLVLYYFRSKRAVARLVWFWLILLMAVGAYGIFQHHHGLLWQEMAWLLSEGNAKTHILGGYVRVFSTVGDAATFGFLMIMGVLLAFAMALTARGWVQVLLVAATLPMLYGMTVSYSRGPVVALAAGAAMMILASRNWKLGITCALVGCLGLGGLAASGNTRFLDRLATATNPTEDASFNVRTGYIMTYAPEIAKRPFGFGINTSGGGARRVSGGQAVRKSVVGVPTDNYYFKVALEMGWVGLGLWLWICGLALWHAYRVYRRTVDPELKAIALGCLSVLFALLVGAFSNDIIAQKPISEFFWLSLGLIVLIGQHRPPQPAPPAMRFAHPALPPGGSRP